MTVSGIAWLLKPILEPSDDIVNSLEVGLTKVFLQGNSGDAKPSSSLRGALLPGHSWLCTAAACYVARARPRGAWLAACGNADVSARSIRT